MTADVKHVSQEFPQLLETSRSKKAITSRTVADVAMEILDHNTFSYFHAFAVLSSKLILGKMFQHCHKRESLLNSVHPAPHDNGQSRHNCKSQC